QAGRRTYSSSPASACRTCQAQLRAPSRPLAIRPASSRPLSLRTTLSASRDFSSSIARRKEKAQDDDDTLPEEIKERPRQDGDAVEVKSSSSSEPTPIPGADGKAASSGGGGGSGGGESGSGAGDGGGRKRKAPGGQQLVKPSVPDVYPQVMAIPIAQRPLFPGFYKAITIRDPNVIAAVQELLKRGQSYV
ncbi:ATP-dependent Lon protease pim1, partial [Teratosphaeriaceae sp. CCFEE 6253]